MSIAKGIDVQRVHARVRRLEKAALVAQTVAMIQNCKVVFDSKNDPDHYRKT